MKTASAAFAMAFLFLTASPTFAIEMNPVAGESKILAGGLTPGGVAIWFGVALVPEIHHSRVAEYARETVVDSLGQAVFDLSEPIALRSLWFVVDQATGRYAVASPEGYHPKPLSWFRGNPHSKLTKLESESDKLLAIVVRTGGGAWGLRLYDQSNADEERSRGRANAPWSAFKPLNKNNHESLDKLRRGDVVLVVDIDNMQFVAATTME